MGGELSIPDRAKLRLLIGTQQKTTTADAGHELHTQASESRQSVPRMLQEQQAVGSGGMSLDTVAIVLSLLVGAAGYLVQAYTARRAERTTQENQHEMNFAETTRQREHERECFCWLYFQCWRCFECGRAVGARCAVH